jgi:hypothetical protein
VLLPPGRRRSLLDSKVAAAYLAGTTTGAALTTMAAWVLSGFAEPLGPASRAAMLCLGAGFVWLVKQGPLGRVVTLPEARRQIPAEVFGGGLVRGAYRFGLELGTGTRTYVPSPAPYLLLLAVILGRPTLGAALLVALGFGVGRALPLVALVVAADRGRFTGIPMTGTARFGPNLATLLVLVGALSLV